MSSLFSESRLCHYNGEATPAVPEGNEKKTVVNPIDVQAKTVELYQRLRDCQQIIGRIANPARKAEWQQRIDEMHTKLQNKQLLNIQEVVKTIETSLQKHENLLKEWKNVAAKTPISIQQFESPYKHNGGFLGYKIEFGPGCTMLPWSLLPPVEGYLQSYIADYQRPLTMGQSGYEWTVHLTPGSRILVRAQGPDGTVTENILTAGEVLKPMVSGEGAKPAPQTATVPPVATLLENKLGGKASEKKASELPKNLFVSEAKKPEPVTEPAKTGIAPTENPELSKNIPSGDGKPEPVRDLQKQDAAFATVAPKEGDGRSVFAGDENLKDTAMKKVSEEALGGQGVFAEKNLPEELKQPANNAQEKSLPANPFENR